MSLGVLFWLTIAGLLLVTFTATGVRVFHEFSHYELEQFCKRRNQAERYDQIVAWHENLALAAEALQSLGATLVLLTACSSMFQLARLNDRIHAGQFLAALLVGTTILLVTTTWIPWAVVRLWSSEFLYHTWRIWYVCAKVAWPLTIGVGIVGAFFGRMAGREVETEEDEDAWEDEVRSLVMSSERDGLVETDLREMIEGVMELDKSDVSQVMTPRSRVDAINIAQPLPEILELVSRVGRTRLPVYEQRLENIIGILFVKDLLSELAKADADRPQSIRPLLREAWFVPTSKPVDKMLRDFLKTRSHLAVVLDEYHNVAGVVTIEDILEEIVGEITDETDPDEVAPIVTLSSHEFEVLGSTSIGDLNDELDLTLPESDDIATVAGLFLKRVARIPQTGDEIDVDNVKLRVIEASRRAIQRLQLTVMDRIDESAASD